MAEPFVPQFESRLDVSLELLARAKQGDRGALNDLIERYQDRVLRTVRIRLGPRLRGTVESVDVAQDVLRIACEELASLEASSNANILQWLSAVVENRLRTLNRRANAGARALDHAVPLEEPVGGQAPAEQLSAGMGTPSLALRRRETQALIDACIHELPEAEREVLILREYHGAEWSVVRERLGRASIHAAQQLHQRAKEHLRRKLAARLR